jgi:ketosteroid isomerase-like protein
VTAGRRTLLESVFEAFAAGNFGSAIPLFDQHIVLVIDEAIPDGGRYVGVDGVRDYMARFLEPWERLVITAQSMEEVGDTVLVAVTQNGTGRGSQVPADFAYFQLWTFRGDRVVRLEVVRDEDRARAMLGQNGS